MIEFDNVQLGYSRRIVLRSLNFRIQKGDFFGIVGPNGAGKTTILKAILGLLKPIKGQIRFINDDKGSHKRSIGYVPQHASLDELFPVTVMEMVIMGRYRKTGILNRPGQNDYMIAEEMLKSVGMEKLKEKNYRELSGGQKQRTLIARAMVGEPDTLILDEPVEGMDIMGQTAIMELIRAMHTEYALTVILVSHDLNIVANYVKTLSIIDKNTLKIGPVDSILNEETMGKVYGIKARIIDVSGRKAIITLSDE